MTEMEQQGSPKRKVFGQTRPPQPTVDLPVEAVPTIEPVLPELAVTEPSAELEYEDVELPQEEVFSLPPELQPEEPVVRQVEHPLMSKITGLSEYVKHLEVNESEIEEEAGVNPLDVGPDPDLRRLLQEKVKEFRFLGYDQLTETMIWAYLQQLRKKRPRNLHELVNAILTLQPQSVVNFDLQSAYRNQNESLEDILNDLG